MNSCKIYHNGRWRNPQPNKLLSNSIQRAHRKHLKKLTSNTSILINIDHGWYKNRAFLLLHLFAMEAQARKNGTPKLRWVIRELTRHHQLCSVQSYIPSCSQMSTRKSTISYWFQAQPTNNVLATSMVLGFQRVGDVKTYSKRNRLREWLVAPEQTLVCRVPTAKPEWFNHAERMSADKRQEN